MQLFPVHRFALILCFSLFCSHSYKDPDIQVGLKALSCRHSLSLEKRSMWQTVQRYTRNPLSSLSAAHSCRYVIVNLSQIKIVKPFCTSEGMSECSIQVMLPITTIGNNIHLSLTFKMIYVQYCSGINVKIHTLKFTNNELCLQTVPQTVPFTFAICMCWFSHVTIKTRFKKCLCNVQIAVFAQ